MTDREIDKLIMAVNGGRWWPWFKRAVIAVLLLDACYMALVAWRHFRG